MTLQLIGAGLPRTGTSSLREGLRYLLGAPVYHMSEAFAHPEHARAWVAAMEATVLPRTREMLTKQDDDPMVPLFKVIFRDLFTDIDDRDQAMAGYERWLGEVRAEVAPERLIDRQPGDGWRPICRALGMPVPDRPFPHENRSADYVARKEMPGHKDEARIASVHSSSLDTLA